MRVSSYIICTYTCDLHAYITHTRGARLQVASLPTTQNLKKYSDATITNLSFEKNSFTAEIHQTLHLTLRSSSQMLPPSTTQRHNTCTYTYNPSKLKLAYNSIR